LSVYGRGSQADQEPDSRAHVQQQLVDFILEFQIDNAFIYRYDIAGA
jgi:DNA replication licensing factor MCM5